MKIKTIYILSGILFVLIIGKIIYDNIYSKNKVSKYSIDTEKYIDNPVSDSINNKITDTIIKNTSPNTYRNYNSYDKDYERHKKAEEIRDRRRREKVAIENQRQLNKLRRELNK